MLASKSNVVVIGDMGGQRSAFENVLDGLGVGSDYRVPDGLTIVQVGDVARCVTPNSPLDSFGCVKMADDLITANDGRYIQLLGNHEFAHLPSAKHPSHWYLDTRSAEVIRSWWDDKKVSLATVLSTTSGDNFLVTHAGLTRLYWERLGSPVEAAEAALRLNAFVGQGADVWSRPGWQVTGKTTPEADCVWAEASRELIHPWMMHEGEIPFQQIHGHSMPVNWGTGEFWDDVPDVVRAATVADHEARLSRTLVGQSSDGDEMSFYSVDWMLGNSLTSHTYGLMSWGNAKVLVAGASIPVVDVAKVW